VGFILLGLATGASDGYSAVTFYVVVYALLTLGAFATIVLLSPLHFEAENINDFKGLARRNPWIAFLMMIFMFSFAGIPPTVGFYAKFIILKSLVEINLILLSNFLKNLPTYF
jgi:NADH-quinone oxidoreductase subunit N